MCIWFAFGSHTPLSIHFHEEIHTKRGIDQLKAANRLVESYLKKHEAYDLNDLFRIAMNTFKTPEELLSQGIRRRVISGQ
jgi:hypothetical protein